MISNPKIIITKHLYSEDPNWRRVTIRFGTGVKNWFYTIEWKLATSSNETLRNKSQIIRNAYRILKKKKKKDSIKHLLYFLLPEPPPPHTDARRHISRPIWISNYWWVWIFFWDVNNLICYGFFCILVFWLDS